MAIAGRAHRRLRPVGGAAGRVVAASLLTLALVSAPATAGQAPLTRAAMAEAVVAALGIAPSTLGPAYADVLPSAPYAGAVEAGANASLWGAWQPGARFRPTAAATLGSALQALVTGLGGARAAADLPDGLRRTAALLGLLPAGTTSLDAPLGPETMRWLASRVHDAPVGALAAVDARLVRGIVWLGGGGPVAVGSESWLGAVAVDRQGYALPAPVSVTASAGSENSAADSFVAPNRAGAVTLMARTADGAHATLKVKVEGPLRAALVPAPRVLPAGVPLILEAGVTAGGGAFAADSGRTIELTVRQGGASRTLSAPDDFGLAPFLVAALRPGLAVVTVGAAGLGARTYDLRVAAAPAGAAAAAAGPLSTAAPRPVALVGAANLFGQKGLWLPYWIWRATPLSRLLAQARASGTRTIYLEVATSANGVYGRKALDRLLPAARRAGLNVVGWIYADLARPAADFANLRAVARFRTPGGLGVAGIALDLEGNVALPTWALAQELALGRRLLGAEGALLAVTYPAGALAPPYGLIARYATAIAPMDYWHGSMQGMGYDVAFDAVAQSIRAIRAQAPSEPVSVVTQAFDMFTTSAKGVYAPSAAELSGALAAASQGGAEGVSFYQWGTISPAEWRVVDLPWPPPAPATAHS